MGKRDEKVTKDGKPIYKKWWFWLIIAIVVIMGATGNSESNSSTKNKSETKTETKKESAADKKERLKKEAEEKAETERVAKEAEEKAQAEKAAKEAADKAAQEAAAKAAADKAAQEAADRDPNSYQALPYEEMARNGNNHKGEKLQITGTVIQVTDSAEGGATLRVATNGKYDDVYMVQISKNEWQSHRLLKDDVITFYGYVYGLYSYKSVMGGQITVPALIVKFY